MDNDNSKYTAPESPSTSKKFKTESKLVTNDDGIKKIPSNHPACQFQTDKHWLDCQYHDLEHLSIKKPDELENEMEDPPENYDKKILDRIHGSLIGMAIGDALGAHVEFRPREYLRENPVEDLQGGGTWGLQKGQFTDDTSMALCLANSLIAREGFNCYDQLVRYKWWYHNGYMSSTGKCFDIGAATSQSLSEFARRQKVFSNENDVPLEELDYLSDVDHLKNFDIYCSEEGVAGNGALMRLTPVPLYFYKTPVEAVEFSGISGQITHGDQKAYDACRYYGALIVAALNGETKEQLLDKDFYLNHQNWFNGKPLHSDIMEIAEGSFKKTGGYDEGIRGKGYIVNAIEAALWAFWSDENSFKKGAIAAVNLGDDTDTTAAIYGQLAGAFYGYENLPSEWAEQVYAKKFIHILSKWIAHQGQRRKTEQIDSPSITSNFKLEKNDNTIPTSSETPILNPPTTQIHKKTDYSTSTHSDRTSKNEPLDAVQPYRYNQIDHSSSNNKQLSSTLKALDSINETRTWNTRERESITSGTLFSQESISNGLSTNRSFNLNKSLMAWTVNDVCHWIQSFGQNYSIYADSFRKDCVDGFRLYRFIDRKVLVEYGISNEAHRQKILDSVQQLRKDFISNPRRYWNT